MAEFGKSLAGLLYPEACAGCIRNEPLDDHIFCIHCLSSLSFTAAHAIEDPRIEQHFWGRIPFEWGMSMLYFVPGGITQKMLFQIKYRGRKDFAEKLGEWYGSKIISGSRYTPADLIVPVPLHPKKLQKRGYNQSAFFAKGLSRSLEVPLDTEHLERVKQTPTQTHRTRIERLENMEGAFRLGNHGDYLNKRIILVDDVLTTGATLEACAVELLNCPGVKLGFITIATGRI